MRKKKTTRKQRKAERIGEARRRFYDSTVVKCFVCGTWQQVTDPRAEHWRCHCGAGGPLGGTGERMKMTEILVDEWTERMVRFWTSDELEEFAAKAHEVSPARGVATAGRLFVATAEIFDILADGDCWSEEQLAIMRDVPDLQRVDWLVVAEEMRHG